MKKFNDFLIESKKTYKFMVRVAGDLPGDFSNKLETSLDKYKLLNLSPVKTTPIQAKPFDFPQLQNCEVSSYDVEVEYPATSHVLERYLADCCNISHSHICVRSEFDPIEAYQPDIDDEETVYTTKLTQEDMGGESAQDDVGSNRVMELLKELESDRLEREVDPATGGPTGESKDISNDENSKSVVG